MSRYAIYYAPPPESPLWTFGSAVLGYDAATSEPRAPLAPNGIDAAEWAEITAQPRRYGFHGTLKAPFRLADGATEDDLVRAGHAFSRRLKSFDLPALEIGPIASFAALKPLSPSDDLERLAAACVEAFEPFRAALSPQELARRQEAPLTDRQRDQLRNWGYPYVFEDFRFHMTLTGSLDDERLSKVVDGLAELYDGHVGATVTRVGAITLFVEEDPARGFRIVDRFVFGG